MWKPVLILTLFMEIVSNEAAKKVQCGGIYTATRGVLSTPNFPGPFAVPIKCQWVIDASNSISTNTSIIIYLTQLFTFEGLTFTEYQLYGNDYKIHPKIIHKVNESNVIRTKWIQTYQNYLVIDLKMQSGESAHLRVLDKFLDTYGFNITYEITTNGNVRVPSCTMMDCGFTGICLDHYTQFSCSCFDGYSGPNCSEGPKSYCYKNGTPTCKNGGTCLHVGVAAVKCHCSKLFTGNTCETPVDSAISKDCPNCLTNCLHDRKLASTCKCLNGKLDAAGQSGFFSTLHLSNLPTLESNQLEAFIQIEILKQLRLNVSKIEDLKVINLIHYTSGADVTFQVKTSSKTDERKVKNVLNKWIDRGYVGNITVTEKDNSMKTSLAVQSVDINQQGVIRENDEFILSCVARGSPSMTFRWFKDGTFVNLTYARHKWIKLIKDPHVTDQYTALLAVERTQKYDEGKFTCQVEDFNIQQCMSKFVKVKRRPLVKIEPMSLTVRKGQNFTVKCITSEGNGGTTGKYTYSWTKNKELLPVVTNTEKYETLYPTGTILQVFHAEKDATYSCLVQDVSTSSERSIDVIVIDRAGVHTCPNESSYDVHWPETAPDTDFMQNCPKDYLGTVSRRCMLNDGKHPTWNIPDFSYCTAKHMNEIFEKFEELKLGYATTNIDNLLYDFSKYVSTAHLRPGEGAKLLSFIQSMYTYLDRSKLDNKLVQGFANTVFQVLDRILSSANSLLNFKEINLIQIIIFDQFKLLDLYTTNWESFKSFKRPLNTLDIAIQTDYSHKDTVEYSSTLADRKLGSMSTWMSAKITAQQSVQPNNSNLLITVVYRNLSEFLPPKSFLRIGDGTEIEYQIFSQIITFSPVGHNRSIKDEGFNRLTIVFQHKFSTEMINISENEQWEIQCGFVDARSLAYTWDIYACYPEFIDKHSTRCVCPKFGSFVLLLVLTQIEETTLLTKEPDKYILICSFVFATILILFTTLCLVVSCVIARCSCILILKLQCSISLFVCEILFTLAILLEPSQRQMFFYLTFLQMLLLLAISSHLSKLLIIFIDLIEQVPKTVSSKYTVMGIISGVPLITIFGNHLAYKSMNLNLKSWWIIRSSLAFNIFLTVVSIITGLFIFIYLLIVNKLKRLMTMRKQHESMTKEKWMIALIRRAACMFLAVLGFIVSSTIYINNQNLLWSIYQFGGVNIIMGLSTVVCYIFNCELGLKYLFTKQPKIDDKNYFSVDLTEPLHFTIQKETEILNQSPGQGLQSQISLRPLDNYKIVTGKTQAISNAFESCLQTSSNFCTDLNSLTDSKSSIRNEKNHTTPMDITKTNISCFNAYNNFSQSPDILTATNLDLVVAHSICTSTKSRAVQNFEVPPLLKNEHKPMTEPKTVRIIFPPQVIVTPDEDSVQIQCERRIKQLSNGEGDDDGKHVETLLNKQENLNTITTTTTTTDETRRVTFKGDKDHLDGVLDRISHDLDYLLNRGEDNIESSSSISIKKHMTNTDSEKILSELLLNDDTPTLDSILLRTNC